MSRSQSKILSEEALVEVNLELEDLDEQLREQKTAVDNARKTLEGHESKEASLRNLYHDLVRRKQLLEAATVDHAEWPDVEHKPIPELEDVIKHNVTVPIAVLGAVLLSARPLTTSQIARQLKDLDYWWKEIDSTRVATAINTLNHQKLEKGSKERRHLIRKDVGKDGEKKRGKPVRIEPGKETEAYVLLIERLKSKLEIPASRGSVNKAAGKGITLMSRNDLKSINAILINFLRARSEQQSPR